MPPLIALIVQALSWAVVLGAIVCFVDALIRPTQAFPAIDRQTKPFWLFILALCGVVAALFSAVGFFGLFASVGVVFYLVDVRPKVKAITGR
ncbi:MAG: DUF2516 family protein [Actinobacteria bacterium]|jgi:hypothetical protein|uniref:Unannotated protein n=1 Tax=freshwater metagenome TaxID=449393 RepID=A0A6J7JNZ0_9ZZZZ|nr:DUF2516 family protein [Actinomycetota bacterium]MSW41584.1 DUF2516 family protein [Actinomycetota bacterium]